MPKVSKIKSRRCRSPLYRPSAAVQRSAKHLHLRVPRVRPPRRSSAADEQVQALLPEPRATPETQLTAPPPVTIEFYDRGIHGYGWEPLARLDKLVGVSLSTVWYRLNRAITDVLTNLLFVVQLHEDHMAALDLTPNLNYFVEFLETAQHVGDYDGFRRLIRDRAPRMRAFMTANEFEPLQRLFVDAAAGARLPQPAPPTPRPQDTETEEDMTAAE